MKKYLKIIIPLILICITGLVIYHFVSKVKLNSSYVNGNTGGFASGGCTTTARRA